MHDRFAYVGCRTTRERNARGEGISTFSIDRSGRWTLADVRVCGANPSFLALTRDGGYLYAVHGDTSAMSAFRVDGGSLEPLGSATIAGLNPVDLILSPDERFVVVTNHLTGALAARSIERDGSLGPLVSYLTISGALGPHRVEQTSVKPHQARFSPCGSWLAVPNKGADTVSVVKFDASAGTLTLDPGRCAALREGAGPRNIVFSPVHDLAYLVGELDSTVTVLSTAGGALRPLRVHSTLPDDAFSLSRAAAIVLSADGSMLHATNRGHDSVCSFRVDPVNGLLSSPTWTATGGRTPRFATSDPDGGSILYVANEDDDAIVAVDPAGGGMARGKAATPSPVCIVFGPAL